MIAAGKNHYLAISETGSHQSPTPLLFTARTRR